MNAMAPVRQSPELVIRIGTPDDVHEIMDICTLASDENGFLEADPVLMLNEIWPALNRERGIVGIIGTENGAIEGAVLLRIGKMWYSHTDIIEEKGIFIHPDFRAAKGGRAKRLCAFSKRIADDLGIPLIIGVLSNSRTEAKVRMYEREFGKPSGAFFLHGANTGDFAKDAPPVD